ncbi:hypothetical protein CEP52_017903 [Fusarium oligoseptatum]|uniref:Uncharacterized protein n=2 Tax=Fusarium solani species complex TaxID=232080 RepID=A0A428R9Y5_9HYPO|nr:hypothetical protein CEP51_016192 [Fusarium floridanum]RSL74341.1 hypothetical protein CEP52_017903 [Fusarium oligoseptatum]
MVWCLQIDHGFSCTWVIMLLSDFGMLEKLGILSLSEPSKVFRVYCVYLALCLHRQFVWELKYMPGITQKLSIARFKVRFREWGCYLIVPLERGSRRRHAASA